MPVGACENQHSVSGSRGLAVSRRFTLRDLGTPRRRNLLFSFLAHHRFDFLPFGIHGLELRTELPGRFIVGSGEEIDRRLGRIETARGVDARSDAETDVYRA